MRNWLYLLIVTFVVAAALGCKPTDRAEAKKKDLESEKVRIPIEAAYPGRKDISAYFETVARVQAERRVEIVSKGTGLCLKMLAEEGDTVQEDEVLAELDKEELQAQIAQSRVSVKMNEYQMKKAKEQLAEGLLSPYEAENARFAYEQATASLRMQEIQLKHLTIRAPIGGVITQRNIQEGMLVSAGTPVFSVVDPSSYMLPINPPEKELVRLAEGQTARVTIDSRPGEEFTARVRRINPSVDPAAGTVKVTLDFDEDARQYLRDSAFARVQLVMETHENALVVPKDTIIEENARTYVMVVREQPAEEPEGSEKETESAKAAEAEDAQGRAETAPAQETSASETETGSEDDADAEDAQWRAEKKPEKPSLIAERIEVKTGLEDSNYIEVVDGIDEETQVVTLGQHTLKPGSAIEITNAETQILSRADISTEDALASAEARRQPMAS